MGDPGNTFETLVPAMFHIVDRYCDPEWIVPPAAFGIHNFMLVVSGEGVSITDGERNEMMPGMLVYHGKKQSFGFETSLEKLMHVYGVNFDVASVKVEDGQWEVKNIDKLPLENITRITDMELMIRYFSDLTCVWDSVRPDKHIKLCSIFLNIFHEACNQAEIQKRNKRPVNEMDEVIQYIHLHFNRQVSLQTLADLAGLNRNYFCGVFKDYTGISPVDYINSVRIKKAEEFLALGYSVHETASRVGFGDPFYFSKVFRKYKGVAPKAYSKTPMHYF